MCEGKMRWGTKLGVTDVTSTIEDNFIPAHPENKFDDFR